jgi:hypothetical protein
VRRRTTGWGSLALAILTGLSALALNGCGGGLVRKGVQRRLERRLESWLGPAESYRVRIRDTRDAELVLGRARSVEIEGKKVEARGELLLEWVKLSLFDLRYEGGDPDFISVRRSDLEVEFTQEALERYLQTSLSKYDPHVELAADQIHVRITQKFLGSPAVIRASGRLVVQEGRQLRFDAEQASVPFIEDPAFSERYVEDRVNPILDISRMGFPARLESVQVLPGRVRARGSAAIRQEL